MTAIAVTGRRIVLADLIPGAWVRDIALVAAGAGFTGLAAQVVVHVPGSPVPVTGQTFAALLVGASLGWQRSAMSMLLYLVVGLAGAPWLAGGGSGWSASTGYVIGFIFAAALVGALAGRGGDRTPLRTAATMALGNIVIYTFGVLVLMAATGFDLSTALAKGVLPFLAGDALKIVLAAAVLPGAWSLVRLLRRAR